MNFSKRILSALFAVFMIFGLTMSAEAAKKIVAVMPLENVSGFGDADIA